MESAHGQDMRNSEPGECGAVFGRNKRTVSQQERGCIPACFLSHFPDQGCAQTAAPRCGNAGKGKNGRRRNGQSVLPVNADSDAPAEKFLTEVVAVRILSASGMVQKGAERYFSARFQPFRKRIIICVKGPVSAGGQGTSVEGYF